MNNIIKKLLITTLAFTFVLSFSSFAGTSNNKLSKKEQAQQDMVTGPGVKLEIKEETNKEEVRQVEINKKDLKLKSLGIFKTTAYCQAETKTETLTASGVLPTLNHTVATDWKVIPKGSKIMISGSDIIYYVEDCGVKGKVVDLFLDSKYSCKQYGVQKREIFLIE